MIRVSEGSSKKGDREERLKPFSPPLTFWCGKYNQLNENIWSRNHFINHFIRIAHGEIVKVNSGGYLRCREAARKIISFSTTLRWIFVSAYITQIQEN